MATRIFIDGAAGTTGLEIRDRLEGRNEFDLIVLDDAQRKDVGARKEALHEADIAILCLPDEAAREAVKLAEGSDTRIIDASSAHRVADGWTYGMMEIMSAHEIANAQFVSNPGCYPTGFLALMEPLRENNYLPGDWPYTVNAVSGFSGGGKALIDRFEAHSDIAFRTYGLGVVHKHLAEMQHWARLSHPPVFSPSVIPAFRGMIVEIPLSPAGMQGQGASPFEIWDRLSEYRTLGCDLIKLHEPAENPSELLLYSDAKPWDGIDLFVFARPEEWDSPKASAVRLVARLDNLGKGASGAAIQNLNIMCGLPHTTGLRL